MACSKVTILLLNYHHSLAWRKLDWSQFIRKLTTRPTAPTGSPNKDQLQKAHKYITTFVI